MSYIKNPMLERAIHYLLQEQPFLGNMLQVMHIKTSDMLPTAGVCYNKKTKSFEMLVNTKFFESLSEEERVAVLLHEAYHIMNRHVISVNLKQLQSMEKKQFWNISMDLAINQYIKNLPEQAMKLSMFKKKDGGALEPQREFEYYYENIDWEQAKKDFTDQNRDGKGKGMATLDDHGAMEGGEEVTEEEMLKAQSDLFRRTIQKSSFSHTNIPKGVQDFLDNVGNRLSQIDYKRMLARMIKKSMPAMDKNLTRTRPSKRYGYLSPGTKIGNIPNVHIFCDTSGSISVEEMEEFLGEADEILKHIGRKTWLHLFHTNVYSTTKYKYGQKLNGLNVQGGGTDLSDCFEKLKKYPTDVAIFLTDGYYSDVEVDKQRLPFECVFVISRNGTMKHPLSRLGNTVQII